MGRVIVSEFVPLDGVMEAQTGEYGVQMSGYPQGSGYFVVLL